ncbi:hypothetical protein HII31_05316 [Pseudocercospora fuligena]|uniref:DUF7730 domain-containing protein n=1 Tax=Pseudocercospora fuligena TaxID=685502 RepID=A0A8H6RLW7_9PEZI|nr:hypothetical protein HII31_05316 [Pseudocercospora fuligena]
MRANKHNSRPPPMRKKITADTQDSNTPQHPMIVCNGIWSSVVNSKDADGAVSIQRYEWDRNSLQAYAKFRKLYGERKFSKPHPAKPFTASFLDLPAELRNRVYELVLVLDPAYVELSAKTTVYWVGNEKAREHHLKRYKYDIQRRLRLLRVCKQIYEEASPMFYGENEFRFTSVKGWYALATWIDQIRPRNQRLIRKISIHVPWRGKVYDFQSDNEPESRVRMDMQQSILADMGLTPRQGWKQFNQLTSVKRVKKVLESHAKLEVLRLVIPDSFNPVWETTITNYNADVWDCRFVLDKTKFESLQIKLLTLQGSFEGQSDPPYDRAQVLATHRPIRRKARQEGIELEDVLYDGLGHYPVPSSEDREILEVAEDDGQA